MLLYNVTIKIDRDAEQDWLKWMKEKHIPEVVDAGKFSGAQISRLLDEPDGEDPTYVIQYTCENREQYNLYIHQHSPRLRDEHNERYKNKFVAFRSLMEIV